jgi:hypothetical protein
VSTQPLLTLPSAALVFAIDHGPHLSGPFAGPKPNTGTVTHDYHSGRRTLRESADSKVPDTPAPTWRLADSNGTIYTLDAFKIKGGDKREVTVPYYVKDIANI